MQKHAHSLEQKATLQALIQAVESTDPPKSTTMPAKFEEDDDIEAASESLRKRRRSLD
jgi:hypothetical protein